MTEADQSHSATSRALTTFKAVCAIAGGLYFIFQGPSSLAKEFDLSVTTRVILHVSFAAVILAVFAVLYIREVGLDLIFDRPLPGFKSTDAGILLAIARRVLPELLNRKRNHVAMAVGVGCTSLLKGYVIVQLRHFAQTVFPMFARELKREVDFNRDAVKRLADDIAYAITTMERFVDVTGSWIDRIGGLDGCPSNLRTELKQQESVLRRIRDDLCVIAEREEELSPTEIARMPNKFSAYSDDIRDAASALNAICDRVEASRDRCRDRVRHFSPWRAL